MAFFQRYYVWLSISALLILMLPFSQSWLSLWQLDSHLIWSKPWTWVSAHFTHVNYAHASVNIAAWLCLQIMADRKLSQQQWGVALLSTLVIVNISLLFLSVDWRYAGFSSVLLGLCAWACLCSTHIPKAIRWVIYIGLCISTLLAQSPDYLAGHVGAKSQHICAMIWGAMLAWHDLRKDKASVKLAESRHLRD